VRRRLGIVPPLTPGAVLRPPLARLAFPLAGRHCRQTAHATDALRLGVHELGLGDGDEVLVPARHDPRMLRMLHAAGVRSRHYAGTASLAPDDDGAVLRVVATPDATLAAGGSGRLALARRLVRGHAGVEEPETTPADGAVRAASATTARLLWRLAAVARAAPRHALKPVRRWVAAT
jgi:hypothetical protein